VATAVVAEGKVMVASMGGKPAPGVALIWPDGAKSDDPAVLDGPLVPNGRATQPPSSAVAIPD
jgi:uncharacterized oxidoreductase